MCLPTPSLTFFLKFVYLPNIFIYTTLYLNIYFNIFFNYNNVFVESHYEISGICLLNSNLTFFLFFWFGFLYSLVINKA